MVSGADDDVTLHAPKGMAMRGDTLWVAAGLVLVFEGLFPFISPGGWRQMFLRIVQLRELTVIKRNGRRVPFDRDKLARRLGVVLTSEDLHKQLAELGRRKAEIKDVEEERRLFYVACTRARTHLALSWAERRETRGRESRRQPSRFLLDLRPRPAHRAILQCWFGGHRWNHRAV